MSGSNVLGLPRFLLIGSPPIDMLETGDTSRECLGLLIVGETVTVPPLFWDELIDEATVGRMLEVGLDVLNIEFGIFCE